MGFYSEGSNESSEASSGNSEYGEEENKLSTRGGGFREADQEKIYMAAMTGQSRGRRGLGMAASDRERERKYQLGLKRADGNRDSTPPEKRRSRERGGARSREGKRSREAGTDDEQRGGDRKSERRRMGDDSYRSDDRRGGGGDRYRSDDRRGGGGDRYRSDDRRGGGGDGYRSDDRRGGDRKTERGKDDEGGRSETGRSPPTRPGFASNKSRRSSDSLGSQSANATGNRDEPLTGVQKLKARLRKLEERGNERQERARLQGQGTDKNPLSLKSGHMLSLRETIDAESQQAREGAIHHPAEYLKRDMATVKRAMDLDETIPNETDQEILKASFTGCAKELSHLDAIFGTVSDDSHKGKESWEEERRMGNSSGGDAEILSNIVVPSGGAAWRRR